MKKSKKLDTRNNSAVVSEPTFIHLLNRETVRYQIQEVLSAAVEELFSCSINAGDVEVESPANESFGDYATNLALILARRLQRPPSGIAEEMRALLVSNNCLDDILAKVEIAGVGFINFTLKTDWLWRELQRITEKKEKYGSSMLGDGHCEMVEFNQANTNKHFHVGHLRNTSLGESLCRLLAFNGFKVWRTSYQGDIGLHVAKTIWAIRRKNAAVQMGELSGDSFMDFISEVYVFGSAAYEEDTVAKKEIDELNREIYQAKLAGEGDLYELWESLKTKSLEYFEGIYKLLATRFDKLYFDSDVVAGKEDVLRGLKTGVFEESDGAVIFPGKKYGLHNRVFINSLGVPTYDAKDIRLAQFKARDFDFEHCIFVLGEEQKEYLKVIMKVLELLKIIEPGEYFHRFYGFINLSHQGRVVKMSSRLGNVVTLMDLVKEAKLKIREYLSASGKNYSEAQMQEIVETVAVAALKYSMLKVEPEKAVAFDMEKSISFEGDSGPYLQYTYARAGSILRRAESLDYGKKQSYLFSGDERGLISMLIKFPEVVNDASRNLEPHRLCSYLFSVAQKFNHFYQKFPVLQASDDEAKKARLLITSAAAQVLKNGLHLLGISTLEEL